jgi:ParB-like chromosome segregation protein Spo0J
MKIEQRNVTALIPYAKNSRTHSDAQVAQIAASIKEFGWTNPILVDGDNGIIAGHGRLMAARKLGHEKVPVIELKGMTETQKKAYIIADNQLAMNSGWDTSLLTLELTDLQEDGFDLGIFGFDPKELNALLEPEIVEGLTDEDAVTDLPEEPKTKMCALAGDGLELLEGAVDEDEANIKEMLEQSQAHQGSEHDEGLEGREGGLGQRRGRTKDGIADVARDARGDRDPAGSVATGWALSPPSRPAPGRWPVR